MLKGASGVLCPGRVAAIMGPSGAGKTTLLHLLCGKNRPERGRGSIHINNVAGYSVTDLQRVARRRKRRIDETPFPETRWNILPV